MAERLVIIGSGPAAWAAATYAARFDLFPLVYEAAITEGNRVRGALPLGALNWTTTVDDYPGFPGGVLGPDLVLQMREQAVRLGARVVTEDVVSLGLGDRPFTVTDSAGSTFETHAVIVATGGKIRELDVDAVREFLNRGVTRCPVSDCALPRFRNKPVVVVGGGDAAVDATDLMSRFSNPVYLVHRRDRLRAAAVNAGRVLANPRVRVVWNSVLVDVLGDDDLGVTGVQLRSTVTGADRVLAATGLMTMLGRVPNPELVLPWVEVDAEGYIILKNPPHTVTSVPGVFAAGEVADPLYRKAVTAAGMGCRAAFDAVEWLAEQNVL